MTGFKVGDRVRVNYDLFCSDQRNLADIMAAENYGGWKVEIDQRPAGGSQVILESKDWRGETRYLRADATSVVCVLTPNGWLKV